MTGEEWLEILAELDLKDTLTADRAALVGADLAQFDPATIREALGRVKGEVTAAKVRAEIRRPSSKWSGRIANRHAELFPNGCANRMCDLCHEVVDINSATL